MSEHEHSTSLKSLYLILAATFLFGFIAGVILYLQNNTGNEGDGSLQTSTKGFTIQAYMYGECERRGGCPSYRIANDGSYVFIVRTEGQEEVKYENILTGKQLETIRDQLSKTYFADMTHTKFVGTCPASVGSVAYRYEIEYKGERYTFDSCVEQVVGIPLMDGLKNYFGVFNTLQANT